MNCFNKKNRVCIIILLFLFSAAPFATGRDKKFNNREYRWAVKWINSELSFFMGNGVIKKIESNDDVFRVWAGDEWNKLEFARKGEFLKNLSRAREITGHSPFFTMFDSKTEEIIASVSKDSIEIVLPGEGFSQYIPLNQGEKNTFY
jgi:hypothetical protein